MSVQTRPLTYDDLCQLPDDGNRYEIIDGELIVSPAPGLDHQGFGIELIAITHAYVRQHRLGLVLHAPVDVRLSPHDVVEPDLIFIRQDRLHIAESRRYVLGPPDLAVEIISPSSVKIDPSRKFNLYERAGVPEYWLVDPRLRTFRMFTLAGERYAEVEPHDGRLASVVIPGLVLHPAALFAEVDRMFTS